jgi:pimeloyl-ACP methyl ester carboxylesterase
MKLSVNGRQAYAYSGGKAFDPELPCVTFIHGALHDHGVWTLLARWCAHHGFGVLAIDQPGHGRTAGAVLDSIEALAEWTLALLDAAGVRQTMLVGHSMGALIALQAAARAPQRASHLLMLGAAYPMKVSESLLNTARDEPFKAIDMVNVLSISTPASKPSYPGPGMWVHGSNRALMRRTHAAQTETNLFHHDFSLCDRYAGGADAMARVPCPTTLVIGARDQMTPPKASRDLARALKATVHTVPSGHHMMAESPDAVLAALRAALGQP